MNYARPMEKPRPDEATGAPCLEGSAAAAAPPFTVLRERTKRGVRVEDRLLGSLSPIAELSYGEGGTGNALIQGENLRVLDALQSRYASRVRCVYIDPPYNNQERYRHYLDTRSHEVWLDMMVTRLLAIRPLLSIDGSLWISIDDREIHYLKVAADEIFGRENFVTTVVWQQRNIARKPEGILQQSRVLARLRD